MAEEVKSVVYETLKKISYENVTQFVTDINRNFALIQNSPLYKGLPGLPGDEGDPGTRGIRGTKYLFVNVDAFNKQFPGEIINGSIITLNWLNTKLQNFVEKNKLLVALGTDTLVDSDIIVLTNSIMLQYVLLEDILKDTGIAFNQQSNLVSSIETKIEQYVKYYVDNHPSILSIQNIFEHYITYAKNYASTNNTYITNAKTKSSVYMPYFAGVTDTQGVRLDNHKYFGFSDKEFPEANMGSIVFGSMKRYCRLMLQTISTTQKETYTSDYAPGENNIPSAIFLQDTDNACLMFGRKKSSNLRRFGMIYKDKDDNLIIKSDMGNLETDYSNIIVNKMFLKYNKEVYFGDNLNLDKDFLHVGNTNNKFYRTAEYIWNAKDYGPISLSEGTQEELTIAAEKRRRIMEVGYWLPVIGVQPGADAEYRNLNESIILPWFVKNVLVTDTKGEVLKTYFIEYADISVQDAAITKDNLDDLLWSGTTPDTNAVITSNYLETVIKKINAVQQYSKINYWRKNQFASVIGAAADIPSLNLSNSLNVNSLATFGPFENPDKQYFIPSITNDTLKLGSNESGSKVIVRSQDFQLTKHNVADIVLTTDGSGNILKTYFRETTSLLDKTIASISKDKNFNTLQKYITSNYFQWIVESLNVSNNNLRDNYWRKEEYAPADNIPKIHNIQLINDLKCRYVVASGIKTDATSTTLDSINVNIGKSSTGRTTIKSNELLIEYLNNNSFLSTDGSKTIKTDFIKETVSLPVVSGLEQIQITITNPEKHLVTSEYLIWVNTRMNKIVGTDGSGGLLGLYWKKSEYKGFKIPDLELSGILKVRGDSKIGPDDNPFLVTTEANKTVEVGQTGTDTNIVLNSDNINLKDTEYAVKVLVTDTSGTIRKDITMCVDSNTTQNADNLVPLTTDDTVNIADAGAVKTKNWKHIITGQQMDWIHTFMNVVKKRFINTFNRKESIDQLYKHFPVGGIMMWTYASAKAAGIEGQIPYGFVVCDGSKIPNTEVNTPDMTNLFVRGVASVADANSVAGADTVKLIGNNIPIHNHSISVLEKTDKKHNLTGGFVPPENDKDANYDKEWQSQGSREALDVIGNDAFQYYQVSVGRLNGCSCNAEGDRDTNNEFWKTNNVSWFKLSRFLTLCFKCFSFTGGEHEPHNHDTTCSYYGKADPDVFSVIPRYYKVVYLMKYDTRIKGGVGFNDKYELVP